jgi:hypothetical protein
MSESETTTVYRADSVLLSGQPKPSELEVLALACFNRWKKADARLEGYDRIVHSKRIDEKLLQWLVRLAWADVSRGKDPSVVICRLYRKNSPTMNWSTLGAVFATIAEKSEAEKTLIRHLAARSRAR